MTAPINLYWWKDQPNFGDEMSRDVVRAVSGREVVWASGDDVELLAVGSLLQGLRNRYLHGVPKGAKPRVWGSGLMFPVPQDFVPHVRMHIVRGPITATILGLDRTRFGDPGILARDVYGDQGPREDVIGLVPHLNHADDPMVADVVAMDPRLRLIDPRRPAAQVVGEIATCAHVISSSLHGLVVADAYGIPNTWLDPAGIHTMAALKFYDYAAGIERPLAPPMPLGDVPARLAGLPTGRLEYADAIATSQAALRADFPASMRADIPVDEPVNTPADTPVETSVETSVRAEA